MSYTIRWDKIEPRTIRTARSRTSGENLLVAWLTILHPTQELEPPANPVRFTPLSIYASSLLRQSMNEAGLRPKQDHLDGLLAVLKVLCQMEEGSCPSSIHLSSLDPGVGKTMAVVCFLKALRQYPRHEDVGVVVFVSRLNEVRKLIDEAGLAKDDFAVLAADEGCNQLSSPSVDQAQVFFTTQQLLSKRGAGRSFSSLQDVYYIGRARSVLVWDETIDPAAVVCPSACDLAEALKLLETVSAQAADDLEQSIDKLKKAAVGTVRGGPGNSTGLSPC